MSRHSKDAFRHAVVALELPDVLERIAARCVNDGARETIRGLWPTSDRERIQSRLKKVRETCGYHEQSGKLPMVDTSVGERIREARDKRAPVPPDGLLMIAGAESAVIDIQRTLHGEEPRYPYLCDIVLRMRPHGSLVEAIGRCIESDGTIKNSASAKLKGIRRSIERAKQDIRKHSERLAKSFGAAEYSTFTGSRYLLLLPREKCKSREGLVHATSHSGESLYFEPFSLLERNNALETLVADERVEVNRIIGELGADVAEVADELLENLLEWERLDVLNAVAEFSRSLSCTDPALSGDGVITLKRARHPLLELSLRDARRPDSLVPLDLRLAPGSRVMVITGPNAGGKTVALKTVGLLVLMFQCGLPIPAAEGTEMAIFETVFADIGDEQSIATSLSTFTSHLRHLDEMCRRADGATLCLVDEIGDGTDPEEGSALAIAALEHLLNGKTAVIATTHYGKVKTFALNTDGVENASMLFDDGDDRPLYQLVQGSAGRSRGLETARRLDFCPPVIARAQSMVGKDTFRLENVLAELESLRIALDREREGLAERSRDLDDLIASYREKERDLREFKNEHRSRAKREAEEMVTRARREIEAIVKEIRETAAARETVQSAHARLETLSRVTRTPANTRAKATDVTAGDRVSMSPTGKPSGRVIEVKKDTAVVEMHGKTLNVKKWNLYKLPADEPVEKSVHVDVTVEPMTGTTIDVRGRERVEALEAVDLFLDRAVLNGLSEILIIHGVGEGVLLDAIQSHLRSDSRVASVRSGETGEGGRGASVVKLK